MQTIGRNEPCHCGSGKKYKKCCALKEGEVIQQAVLERETVDVQSEMLRFAFSQPAFTQTVQKSFAKYRLEDEMRDTFYFFVGIWVLFAKAVVSGKTALELFVDGTKVKGTIAAGLRPSLQEIIKSWVGQVPSVVKVTEVNDRDLVVSDIFSKESIKVKIIDKLTETPANGSLLAGYIVPFIDDISIFFTSALSFEGEVANKIEQVILQRYESYRGKAKGGKDETASSFLQESFLDLLRLFMSDEEPEAVLIEATETGEKESKQKSGTKEAKIATSKKETKVVKGTNAEAEKVSVSKNRRVTKKQAKKIETSIELEKIEWHNEQEKRVASLLGQQLKQNSAGDTVLEAGYMLWRSYCEKKQPVIKNEKVYAAALHYLVVDKVSEADKLTQKEAAELYDASPASVSSRSREMATILEEELHDLELQRV